MFKIYNIVCKILIKNLYLNFFLSLIVYLIANTKAMNYFYQGKIILYYLQSHH